MSAIMSAFLGSELQLADQFGLFRRLLGFHGIVQAPVNEAPLTGQYLDRRYALITGAENFGREL